MTFWQSARQAMHPVQACLKTELPCIRAHDVTKFAGLASWPGPQSHEIGLVGSLHDDGLLVNMYSAIAGRCGIWWTDQRTRHGPMQLAACFGLRPCLRIRQMGPCGKLPLGMQSTSTTSQSACKVQNLRSMSGLCTQGKHLMSSTSFETFISLESALLS